MAIAGKPNSGKSTLLNAAVGEKVAIVSPKPQTTRDGIRGVAEGEGYQIVFTDTPGLFDPRDKLGGFMAESSEKAIREADAVLYVVDGVRGLDSFDENFLRNRLRRKTPVAVALNKTDVMDRERVFEQLKLISECGDFPAVVPVSAKRKRNVDVLLSELAALLPEGERIFDGDVYTDRPLRFLASETIREKAIGYLGMEIPYGVCVEIKKFEEREDGVCEIAADVICEKASHKPIIIGKNGAMLKKIATAARLDIEKTCGTKVFLTLWVRVEKDWRKSDYLTKSLGYGRKDLN